MRLRLFYVTSSILIMAVVLLVVACQSQGSGATGETIEKSPSPLTTAATETAPTPTAEAAPTATPITPSQKRQPAATPPSVAPAITPVQTLDIDTGPGVTIADITFAAELANTGPLRTKGLSERDSLDPQTGMLFIFDDGRVTAFWMKGMRFPLDFVWIGSNCTVVAVTENVPNAAADTPNSSLPLYRSFVEAEYNLEINAGEIEKLGISVGDSVTFEEMNLPGANC